MAILIQDANQSAALKFYASLTTSSNSLALSQLWLVEIEQSHLINIKNHIVESINVYEHIGWDVAYNINAALNDVFFIGKKYYLLARGCTFPGDGFKLDHAGSSFTGMLKAPVGTERNELQEVTITFLETNQSVADLIMRPWAILASHWSLKEQAIRIPIKLTCFQKDGVNSPVQVRKIIELEQAVPFSIDQEEFNYTADKVIDRQVKFVYTRYKVIANVDIKNFFDSNEYAEAVTILGKDTLNNSIERELIKQKPPTAANLVNAVKIPEPTYTKIVSPTGEGLLEKIDDIVDKGRDIAQAVNQAYNTAQSYIGRVQGSVTAGLRLFGADKVAENVDKFVHDKVQGEVLSEASNIISTGTQWVEGTQQFNNALREITSPFESSQRAQQVTDSWTDKETGTYVNVNNLRAIQGGPANLEALAQSAPGQPRTFDAANKFEIDKPVFENTLVKSAIPPSLKKEAGATVLSLNSDYAKIEEAQIKAAQRYTDAAKTEISQVVTTGKGLQEKIKAGDVSSPANFPQFNINQ